MTHRISELARPEAPGPAGPADEAVVEPPPVPRVESAVLFHHGGEVIIVHRGQEYRLRPADFDDRSAASD